MLCRGAFFERRRRAQNAGGNGFMEKQNSPTRSVERALSILECFLDKKEMILLEIAERTGLSSSTALRILNALQEHDFVVKNPQTKKYHLGSKIGWLAEMIPSESYEDLKKIAYPFMVSLNEKWNEHIHLFVPDGHSKLCIETVDSTRELRQVIRVGSRHDILRGAAGKVILSYMTEEERKKVPGLPDPDETAYRKIREKGYALSMGEREEGLWGLASPILDKNGRLAAAISMSGAMNRFAGSLEEKETEIVWVGREISARLRSR